MTYSGYKPTPIAYATVEDRQIWARCLPGGFRVERLKESFAVVTGRENHSAVYMRVGTGSEPIVFRTEEVAQAVADQLNEGVG